MTPSDLKRRLDELRCEHVLAAQIGLTANEPYMDDLLADLAATHRAYVLAAVTEIASSRAR